MNTDSEYPLAKHFETVSEEIKTHGKDKNLTNDDLLILYGLFKQSKEGDVNSSQPYRVQFEARAKWDAWNSQKGKSKAKAQQEYVQYALKFFPEDAKKNYN